MVATVSWMHHWSELTLVSVPATHSDWPSVSVAACDVVTCDSATCVVATCGWLAAFAHAAASATMTSPTASIALLFTPSASRFGPVCG
jgi:hypothetical protein